MMFLDCPAHLDAGDAARCGLPAGVSCRFTMQSADGPIDSGMIRCPAGHWFTRLSNPSPCPARASRSGHRRGRFQRQARQPHGRS